MNLGGLFLIIIFIFKFEIYSSQENKLKFVDVCSNFQINENLFDGNCHLSQANVHNKLVQVLNFIKQYNNTKISIYDFIKDDLFKNTTFHFRQIYSQKSEYIKKLDGFIFNFILIIEKKTFLINLVLH